MRVSTIEPPAQMVVLVIEATTVGVADIVIVLVTLVVPVVLATVRVIVLTPAVV